jgi:hypothetical protein
MFLTPCYFNLHHYLSCFIHFLKELQNHLGLGHVEIVCLVYCAIQKETPFFLLKHHGMSCPSNHLMKSCSPGAEVLDSATDFISAFVSVEQGFDFKSPGSRYQYGGSTSVLGYSSSVSRDLYCKQMFGSLTTGSH